MKNLDKVGITGVLLLLLILVIMGHQISDHSTRLDALKAENEAIIQDLKLHVTYYRILKEWIVHNHPDTTSPDEDTTGYGQSKLEIPMSVIGDSLSPDPDTMSAVERVRPTLDSALQWIEDNYQEVDASGDTVPTVEMDWSFTPVNQPLPDSVKRTGYDRWWKKRPGDKYWTLITDSLEVRQWWNAPPHDQGGE